jgi:hypothetical protein
MSVAARIVSTARLSARDMSAAFDLHSRYFVDVRHETFARDMAEKDYVIQLRDGDGNLVGFSTLQHLDLDVAGVSVKFVFSGNTVVDVNHRNTPALAGSFGHHMLRLLDRCKPHTAICWFLITKGFRTYRFLPVFFHEFYPRYDMSTPTEDSIRMHAIASFKYNRNFDPTAGVVRAVETTDRLAPRHCIIPQHRLRDPHVRFFVDSNPAFDCGDELACIARISRSNFNAFAYRAIAATHVEWDE